MKHKRYVFDWHNRRVIVHIEGESPYAIGFAALESYQRNIVKMLLLSLHRMGFRWAVHEDSKAWVYEGYSL